MSEPAPDSRPRSLVSPRPLGDALVGVLAGVGAVALTFVVTAALFVAGAPAWLPDGSGPLLGVATYALSAVAVGAVVGSRRPLAAAVVGAVVAAGLLGVAYARSFGNPLVFGPVGMVASLLVPLTAAAVRRFGVGTRLPVPAVGPLGRVALAGVGLWLAVELLARWFLAGLLLPVVGSPVAADMLVVAVAFPAAAWFVLRRGRRAGLGPKGWAYRYTPAALAVGLAGAVLGFAALSVTPRLDAALFGAPPSGVEGLFATAADTLWVAALLLVVNGVVVPVAEEAAWRGVIQTALTERYGAALGIGLTAVAFALKHVVVDLSAFRLASLIALALVLGAVRHRAGTAASTVTHLGVNLVATALVLFA